MAEDKPMSTWAKFWMVLAIIIWVIILLGPPKKYDSGPDMRTDSEKARDIDAYMRAKQLDQMQEDAKRVERYRQ